MPAYMVRRVSTRKKVDFKRIKRFFLTCKALRVILTLVKKRETILKVPRDVRQ